MEPIDIIGTLAGIFTTIGVLPQIVKAYKTKEVKGVSVVMFFTIITGVTLWTIYGFMLKDLPIILTNSISLFLNIIMVILAVKYRKNSVK